MGLFSDVTFNSGEYIPQYVGNTLQETKETADALAGRHYGNIAKASALELALREMQSKAVGKGKDYIAERVAIAGKELEEMAKMGGENSTAKLAALTNQLAGDQGVLAAVNTGAGYAKFIEERNKTKDPVYDLAREKQYLEAPVLDPETGQLTDFYARPFDLRVEEGLNYRAKQETVVDDLAADTVETDLLAEFKAAQKSGMAPEAFLQKSSTLALTKNKVNEYLFGNKEGKLDPSKTGTGWASYKDSAEYRQQKMRGLSDQEIAKELQSVGYEKVFSRVSKDLVANPAFKEVTQAPAQPAFDQDLAQTIETPKLPFDIANITPEGNVEKSAVDKALVGFDTSLPTYQETLKAGEELELARKTGDAKKIEAAKAKHKAAREAYMDEFKTTSKARTDQAIPYFTAAAMWAEAKGGETDKMTPAEIKQWAGTDAGKQALKEYEQTVLANRYEAPVRTNPPTKSREDMVKQLEDTFSDRYVIDFNNPGKVIPLSELVTGNPSKEAKEFSGAFFKHKDKLRYPGDVQAQNWLANGTDKSARFANASIIEIPTNDEGTEFKRYYVSKTAGELDPSDVNLKVLTSIGNRVPGIPNATKEGTQVYKPISPAATIALKNKYAQVPGIGEWPTVVEVKFKQNGVDRTAIGASYFDVVNQLSSQGITLTKDN